MDNQECNNCGQYPINCECEQPSRKRAEKKFIKSLDEIAKIDFDSPEFQSKFEKIEEENKQLLKGAHRVDGFGLINYLKKAGFLKK